MLCLPAIRPEALHKKQVDPLRNRPELFTWDIQSSITCYTPTEQGDQGRYIAFTAKRAGQPCHLRDTGFIGDR
jgi:hypothetical protein